jgi:hypothetical protein
MCLLTPPPLGSSDWVVREWVKIKENCNCLECQKQKPQKEA